MSTTGPLRSVDSPLAVELDPVTALPAAVVLAVDGGVVTRRLACSVTLEVGGEEERGWTGGLRYVGTSTHPLTRDPDRPGSRVHRGGFDEHRRPVLLGEVEGQLLYRLFPSAPYLEIALELSPATDVVVRNVLATTTAAISEATLVNAPGNLLRADLPVAALGSTPHGISPLTGLRGSSAVVGLSDVEATLTLWPTQRSEIPDLAIRRAGDTGLALDVRTNFAAVLGPEVAAELSLLTVDLQRGGFDLVRGQWPRWAQRAGLGTPEDKPDWVDTACIYEVQIGRSYFWGDHTYERYATVAALTDDLDRIQSLGFSVLQMMPRQPYPSYNVHDYDDISTSYGDEAELRALVAEAHRRGMRVILDVLLHGVVDGESVDHALEGIRRGPLRDRLDEETGDALSGDLADSTNYLIAWSRHILDFADHWKGGSPARTPLESQHPDWFSRNTAGEVTGIYTKAFDARNREWQRFFRRAMVELVRRLDIDGFRFDAPTYNEFPNWSRWARDRASLSPLGCVPLFVDLRADLRRVRPDSLLYTEPSGPVLRASMDLNYNYDEQWLVTAAAKPDARTGHGVRDAREVMLWFRERDAFLPVGSKTAHHIDSHDTFWWPQWGQKWRREQLGLAAAQMLTVTFAALDGPFMLFTGGEDGVEQELTLLNGLRRDRPELFTTPASFDLDSDPSGHLFILRRGTGDATVAVLVNLTGVADTALPEAYQHHWRLLGSRGLRDQLLSPSGYAVLAASAAPR